LKGNEWRSRIRQIQGPKSGDFGYLAGETRFLGENGFLTAQWLAAPSPACDSTPLSKQPTAELPEISLPPLKPLPNLLGVLLTSRKVLLDNSPVAQVIRDHGIDVGQGRRRIPLDNRLGRCAVLEGADHQLQEDPGLPHPQSARGILPQGWRIRLDQNAHIAVSVKSHPQ